jgi:hypothetical protein
MLAPGVAVAGEDWRVNLPNTLIILALFLSPVLV